MRFAGEFRSIAGHIVGTVLPSIGLIFLGIIGAIVVGIIRISPGQARPRPGLLTGAPVGARS